MADYASIKYRQEAIRAFANTKYAILEAVNGTIDTANTGKVIVPVQALTGATQTTGDTVFQSPTLSAIEIDVTKELFYGTRFLRSVVNSTNTSLIRDVTGMVGVELKNGLNANILNMMVTGAGTKVKYATADASVTGAGTAGALTTKMFTYAAKMMDIQNVPRDKSRNVCVSAEGYEQVQNLVDEKGNKVFYPADVFSKEVLADGYVGKVAGFNVIMDNSISKVTEADGTISTTGADNVRMCALFFHKQSAAWGATKGIEQNSIWNGTKRAWDVDSSINWGSEILLADTIIQVRENDA